MPKLKVDLIVDDKGSVVVKNFGRTARESLKKTTASLLKSSAKIGVGFASLVAGAGLVAFTLGLKESVRVASDLEEISSKFGVVFGDQLDQANAWAEELVDGYAMSTREAKQYLSTVQDILVPMGMQSEMAGKMSSEMVKLAADLGSFNNLPTAQVMDDMMSATVGNYETMKKYGVVLNATVVQEKALNMGLANTKKELTASMKAQATYALMVESSTAAIGDMARTADSVANQEKKFLSVKEDLLAVIGEGLLPYYSKLLKVMNTWGQQLLENKDYLRELTHDGIMMVIKGLGIVLDIMKAFHVAWQVLKMLGTGAIAAIAFTIVDLVKGLRLLMSPLDLLFDGLVKLGQMDANPFDSLEESVKTFSSAADSMFSDVVNDTADIIDGYDDWKKKILELQVEMSRVPAQISTTAYQDMQILTSGRKQLDADRKILQTRLEEYQKFYKKLGKEIEKHAKKELATIKKVNDLYRQQMTLRRSTEAMLAELGGGPQRSAGDQYAMTRAELDQQFQAAQMLGGQDQIDALEKYKQAVSSLAQEFKDGFDGTGGSDIAAQAISDIEQAYETQKQIMAELTTATNEQVEANKIWGEELRAEAENAANGIFDLQETIFDLDAQLAAMDKVLAIEAENRVSSVVQQIKKDIDLLHDKTVVITTIHQSIGAGGSLSSAPGPTMAFAAGGWINEPVVGMGLNSGRQYTFGENESELVTPKSKLDGGGTAGGLRDLHLHLPPEAAPQRPEDYRYITREFVIPELEAAGFGKH